MSAAQASQRPLIPERVAGQMTPEAKAFVDSLIDSYQSQLQELRAKISTLEDKLLQLTPQNSSLPPSSQHPHAKPKPKPKGKKGSKKKRGGQPGHPKHENAICSPPKRARRFTSSNLRADAAAARPSRGRIPIPRSLKCGSGLPSIPLSPSIA